MTMCDEYFLDRAPLGATCDHCHYGQWGASATDVEPEQVLIKGTCTVHGARIDCMAVVHIAPPSSSFSRT